MEGIPIYSFDNRWFQSRWFQSRLSEAGAILSACLDENSVLDGCGRVGAGTPRAAHQLSNVGP